jgi:hypothetical protein
MKNNNEIRENTIKMVNIVRPYEPLTIKSVNFFKDGSYNLIYMKIDLNSASITSIS